MEMENKRVIGTGMEQEENVEVRKEEEEEQKKRKEVRGRGRYQQGPLCFWTYGVSATAKIWGGHGTLYF